MKLLPLSRILPRRLGRLSFFSKVVMLPGLLEAETGISPTVQRSIAANPANCSCFGQASPRLAIPPALPSRIPERSLVPGDSKPNLFSQTTGDMP